jgi:hypothetical protein
MWAATVKNAESSLLNKPSGATGLLAWRSARNGGIEGLARPAQPPVSRKITNVF